MAKRGRDRERVRETKIERGTERDWDRDRQREGERERERKRQKERDRQSMKGRGLVGKSGTAELIKYSISSLSLLFCLLESYSSTTESHPILTLTDPILS